MSKINGDKSRFHRIRKQRIHQRIRNQELCNVVTNKGESNLSTVRKVSRDLSPSSEAQEAKSLPVSKAKVHSHD